MVVDGDVGFCASVVRKGALVREVGFEAWLTGVGTVM